MVAHGRIALLGRRGAVRESLCRPPDVPVFLGACEPVVQFGVGASPGTRDCALSTNLRLVCFGGLWRTAINVIV